MTETEAIKRLSTLTTDTSARLKGILGPLWRILTFSLADNLTSHRKNLSISIEKGRLSIAYGIRFLSRITIKGVKEYLFEEDRYPQPGDLISSVALFIKESGAEKSDITLSIPKAWTIFRTVELPASVKENLQAAVSCEMDRFTPFVSDDAFFDFKVLRDNGEKVSLFVMAARADTIRPYIGALTENGFNVGRLTINLSGMGSLCQYMDRDASDAVWVEVDKDGYESALFIDGAMMQVYSDDFAEIREEEKVNKISSDIRSLIETAKGLARSPQIIALFNDRSPALKELFKSRIDAPIRIMGETAARLNIPGQHGKVPYTAAGSLIQSLQQNVKGPNLLKKGIVERENLPFLLTAILMLAILVTWVLYIIAPLSVEGKRLQEITRQISLKEEEVRKIEALKKEIETLTSEIASINNFKDAETMKLNILKELTSILPQTVWLTGLKITGFTVEIDGFAESATELLPKLEASKYLSKVEFSSPTVRDKVMNSDRFRIKMEIDKTKKSEGE